MPNLGRERHLRIANAISLEWPAKIVAKIKEVEEYAGAKYPNGYVIGDLSWGIDRPPVRVCVGHLRLLARAIASLPPRTGWQPIGTAPRDAEIFVYGASEISAHSRPHAGSEALHQVLWNHKHESWEVSSAGADCWVPEPSHWMPLPSAPSR